MVAKEKVDDLWHKFEDYFYFSPLAENNVLVDSAKLGASLLQAFAVVGSFTCLLRKAEKFWRNWFSVLFQKSFSSSLLIKWVMLYHVVFSSETVDNKTEHFQ